MNRFDKCALAVSILMTLLGAGRTIASTRLYFELRHPSWSMTLAFAAGWIVWTYGPIIIAALLWRWSKRARYAWIAHVVLLPCIWVMMMGGNRLMLFALDVPDFDDTIGRPVMMGLLLSLIAIALYVVALISRGVAFMEDHAAKTVDP